MKLFGKNLLVLNLLLFCLTVTSCGIRGAPIAPEKTPPIGFGIRDVESKKSKNDDLILQLNQQTNDQMTHQKRVEIETTEEVEAKNKSEIKK